MPGTATVVCAIFSIISSQLFDMMRAVARTGAHVRSGHFPTSPTLNPSSRAVALVRNIPTSAFSTTRAFSYKLQALVRNNIPTRAFSYSAFLASTSIIPCTAAVIVCAIFSLFFSRPFDMMRVVARAGTHVRSGHLPTSPTLTPSSQAAALVRNNIPTSAFSSTRAFSC